jgi:hypothetical protein
MAKESETSYWSDCGQIYFTGGNAFGLTAELITICLGEEDVIKKVLEDGQLPDNLNSTQRLALSDIMEYRKEKNGEDIGTGSLERTCHLRIAGRKQKTARQFKARKGLPLHPIKSKG